MFGSFIDPETRKGKWALIPRGPIYTTNMESGPKNQNGDGLSGPNSIMVVYMDPLGYGHYDKDRGPKGPKKPGPTPILRLFEPGG